MNRVVTILLVDDEEAIRDGLKNLVVWEKEGFHIIGEASNGREALVKIKQLQPDIVITDLIMPELDGLELTRTIQQQFPEIHFLVLSSYDEFSYVSDSYKNGAIDYLLKPTLTPSNLLTTLKKVAKKLKTTDDLLSQKELLSQSLNRALIGYVDQEFTDIENFLEEKTYHLLYTNARWYQELSHLSSVLNTLCLEEFSIHVLPFSTGNTAAGLLIASKNQALVQEFLATSFSSLKNVEPQAFFILSNPFSSLNMLNLVFNHLKTQSEGQRFFFKKQLIASQSELFSLDNGDRFDTRKFLRALLDNDFILGVERIEEYFNEMILSSVRPTFLKQQASSIFYTLLSTLEENHPNHAQYSQLKTDFLTEISNCTYLQDFSSLLLVMTESIKKELVSAHSDQEDEQLAELLRYIQDHYMHSISLTQLADMFHFSYTYLSSLISSRLHMSFSDYLKKVRLEKAKELLLHSELNLSEISDATGYSDLSYFSKTFKKEFQLSPSQYRRDNRL